MKITLWSLAGVIGLCTIVIAFVVNVVFSKDKLTPIVRDQLPNYVTCQTDIDNVELTFFSTFPHFALQLHDLVMVNPVEGASCDTLLSLNKLQVVVDAMAYLKHDAIHVKDFRLEDGKAYMYVSKDSVLNYDVFVTSEDDDSKPLLLQDIELKDVSLMHLNLTMEDVYNCLNVSIEGLNANMNAMLNDLQTDMHVVLDSNADNIVYSDSVASFALNGLQLSQCQFDLQDSLHLNLGMSSSFDGLSFSLAGHDPIQIQTGSMKLQDLNIALADKDLSTSMNVVLDSLLFEMGGKEPMTLLLSDATLQLPQAEINDSIHGSFLTYIGSTSLTSGHDGLLLNRLPLSASGQLNARKDFSELRLTDASIRAGQEELTLCANIEMPDTLTMHVSADLSLASTTFARLLALVPNAYKRSLRGLEVAGSLDVLTAKASVSLEKDKPLDIESFELSTTVNNLRYHQNDTLLASANKMSFDTRYPVENSRMSQQKSQQQKKRQNATHNTRRSRKATEASFMQASFVGEKFHFEMHDSSDVVADLPNAVFNCTLSDEILRDSLSLPFIAADFSFGQLTASADTLSFKTHGMTGSFTMADGMRGMKKYYEANFESMDADIQMGQETSIITGPLIIEASSVYDFEQKDPLLRYNPLLNVTLKDGKVTLAEVPYPFELPSIDFDFNLGRFLIRDSQFRYGGSDFTLTGEINNLREYLKKESDLLANLHLKSKQTQVYQLMDLVEQFAAPTDSLATSAQSVSASSEAENYIYSTLQNQDASSGEGPFMVPNAIDLMLTTDIDKTIVGENEFNNLGGKLYIKDGNLVLEEMGFNSKAARMQLTALYRSPQKNNLFVGANFHLLDIDVADLLKMVPEIDSIVPMLRSFEGKAAFHLAAETNLFGNYDVKMSTLKATGAIEASDLVLLDGETFSTIAKYLMFNKQTRNRIDTLSVEMALNRKKMTVFPMLIGMDKYQAVVSGSHELTGNMPFNYHVSITDCPVVGGRLGLDIEGDLEKPDDFTYKLVGCKYASLYKPERRNVTQEQTIALKSLIAEALKRTVKEQKTQ